jgi:methyltransferase (TIGR00027 family)
MASARARRDNGVRRIVAMDSNRPSRTALGAALHRAAHQIVDAPPVFADPLALRIVGEEAEIALRRGEDPRVGRTALRAFIAVRSRFTEDCLDEAYERGVRQYVLLGAGLDTFAYRVESRYPGLAVFEVDHPATQGWKREQLAGAGISIPRSVTYAPVDFERETLTEGLRRAGLDFASPALFAWLGVTPYLTRDAVMATLAAIAGLARGCEVVFDYPEPAKKQAMASRLAHYALAARVAAIGEPFRSAFEPKELSQDLMRLGFSQTEDLGRDALNARYFANRADGLQLRGHAHLMHARV